MAATNPKNTFQEFHPDAAQSARAQFPQPWFCTASMAAVAEMASQGATTDEMRGAQKLLTILINIGEGESEVPRLPVKTLETL